jgi:hypothetical protein
VPPVLIATNLLGGSSGFELLVGFTRLGNLLGLLDREEVPETQKTSRLDRTEECRVNTGRPRAEDKLNL